MRPDASFGTASIADYITPSVVIAVGIALWRLIHAEVKSIRSEIQALRTDLSTRIDRHLENHPQST